MKKLFGLIVCALMLSCATHEDPKKWDNPLDPNGTNWDPPGFRLTFTNQAFTEIDITVTSQGSYTIPFEDSITVVYATHPGSISYLATTYGETNTNDQIGDEIEWDFTHDVTGLTSKTYDLVVSEDWFFIYVRNYGTVDLTDFYVNYGKAEQTIDDIVFPNDSVLYRTGYYQAFIDTEVRAYKNNSLIDYVYWIQGEQFTLPFTQSQSIILWNDHNQPNSETDIDANRSSVYTQEYCTLFPAESSEPRSRSINYSDADVGIGTDRKR